MSDKIKAATRKLSEAKLVETYTQKICLDAQEKLREAQAEFNAAMDEYTAETVKDG